MPSAVLPCGAQVSVHNQHLHCREAGAGCSQTSLQLSVTPVTHAKAMSCPAPADNFIQVWNQRKLPARYYTGLAAGAATMRRTGFQWGVRTGGALQTCCGPRLGQQGPRKGLKGTSPLSRCCQHLMSLVPAAGQSTHKA